MANVENKDMTTVSLIWDKEEDGTFMVNARITGIATEEQAQRAMRILERMLCGGAIPIQ